MSALQIHPAAAGPFQSFEFRFILACPLPTVFAIYTDTDRWCNRGPVDDIRWIHGAPWQEGSRIRVQVREPLPVVVEQVVVLFEPGREVGYTSRVFGMTIDTRLAFGAVSADETEIHVRIDVQGTSWRLFSFAIEPMIEKNTQRFFDDLKKDCEWAALQAKQNRTSENPHAAGDLAAKVSAPR